MPWHDRDRTAASDGTETIDAEEIEGGISSTAQRIIPAFLAYPKGTPALRMARFRRPIIKVRDLMVRDDLGVFLFLGKLVCRERDARRGCLSQLCGEQRACPVFCKFKRILMCLADKAIGSDTCRRPR